MTDEQKNAPPAGGDWDGLKLQAGKIEQQFVNYEQHISQRFENVLSSDALADDEEAARR